MKKRLIIAALVGALAIPGMAMAANQEGGDDPPIDTASIVEIADGSGVCRILTRNEFDLVDNLVVGFAINEAVGQGSIDVKAAGKSGKVIAKCSVHDSAFVEFLINRFNNGSAEPISIDRCFMRNIAEGIFRARGTGHMTFSAGGNMTMHCSN